MSATNKPARILLLEWVAALAGVALLIPRLLQLAAVSSSLLTWPWQFDYTEGVNLNATYLLAHGADIYRHNGPDSFVSASYTPIFYLLNVPFTLAGGPTFGPGRFISLFATLSIAALLAYVVRLATLRWPFGVAAAALWLSLSPVIVWSALYQQNMPALSFGLAGLAWALRRPQSRATYWAVVLFGLAFYTKQTALDAAVAATLWLVLRDFRRGLRFGMLLAAVILAPFAAANLLTAGGLWEHTVGNHILPWGFERFSKTLGKLWGEYWPLLVWASAAVVGAFARVALRLRAGEKTKAGIADPFVPASLYFLVSAASTTLRIGREGSNYNHLLDLLLPACLLAGMSLGIVFRRLERSASMQAWVQHGLGPAAALGMLAAQTFAFNDAHSWYRGVWPSAAHDTQMRLISNLVAATPGDLYSEDAYLLLSNGRRVRYDDAFQFTSLAKAGRWDDSAFNQALRDRRFKLVLLEYANGRFTKAGLEAFEANYENLYEDIRYSFVPKP